MKDQPIKIALADIFFVYALHGITAVRFLSGNHPFVHCNRIAYAVTSDGVPRIPVAEDLRRFDCGNIQSAVPLDGIQISKRGVLEYLKHGTFHCR